MVLHRVHFPNAYHESVQVWEGPIYTGKHVGVINGKDMAGKTYDYEFCVNPSVHTLLMGDSDNSGWTSGSYFDVRAGGVPVAHTLLDSLNLGSLTVYRGFPPFSVIPSVHAPHPQCQLEVLEHCLWRVVRSLRR